jgi:hypothetical protein
VNTIINVSNIFIIININSTILVEIYYSKGYIDDANYKYLLYNRIELYRTNMGVEELFLEHFKGGGKAATTPAAKPVDNNGAANTASGAIAGAATGAIVSGGTSALMSNSGSNNVEKCPLTDDTLYCQVSRTAGITGMLVYILLIIIFVMAFLYFIYYLFFRSGTGRPTRATKALISGR